MLCSILFHSAVHPVIQVPNQLVGAPLGTDVSIECLVEASPKSINYWVKDTGKTSTTNLTMAFPQFFLFYRTRSIFMDQFVLLLFFYPLRCFSQNPYTKEK